MGLTRFGHDGTQFVFEEDGKVARVARQALGARPNSATLKAAIEAQLGRATRQPIHFHVSAEGDEYIAYGVEPDWAVEDQHVRDGKKQ